MGDNDHPPLDGPAHPDAMGLVDPVFFEVKKVIDQVASRPNEHGDRNPSKSADLVQLFQWEPQPVLGDCHHGAYGKDIPRSCQQKPVSEGSEP